MALSKLTAHGEGLAVLAAETPTLVWLAETAAADAA
jgi:hypothetical protein